MMREWRVANREWRGALAWCAAALCAGVMGCEKKPAPGPASGPRIVTLAPSLGIIVRDLGLAGSVVGRDGYDMVLDKALPVCGKLGEIDYETLARARPTVVLMQWGKLDRPARLDEMARAGGWEVRDFQILALDDIRVATRDLASLLGAKARGDELLARMDAAWSKREGLERAGRILILESVSPPAALGQGSWHADLLARLGGVPAVREGKPYVRMDAEDVLRLAPDGIIFFSPRSPGTVEPDVVTGAEALKALAKVGELNVPAVKAGHVAVITDPLGLTPSTAMIGVAEEMAGVLKQWSGASPPSR